MSTNKLCVENKALRYIVHNLLPSEYNLNLREGKENTTNTNNDTYNNLGKNLKTGVKTAALFKKRSMNSNSKVSNYDKDNDEDYYYCNYKNSLNDDLNCTDNTKEKDYGSVNEFNNQDGNRVKANPPKSLSFGKQPSSNLSSTYQDNFSKSINDKSVAPRKSTTVKYPEKASNNNSEISNHLNKTTSVKHFPLNNLNVSSIEKDNKTFSTEESNKISFEKFKDEDKLSNFINSSYKQLRNNNEARKATLNQEEEINKLDNNKSNNLDSSNSNNLDSSIENNPRHMYLFYRTPGNKDNKKFLFNENENKKEN